MMEQDIQDPMDETPIQSENANESEKINFLNSVKILDIDSGPIDSSNDEPQLLTNSITNFVNENIIESDNDCGDTLLDESVEEPYEQKLQKLKEFKDAMKKKEKEEMENTESKHAESKLLSLKANEDVIKKPFVSVERL